MANETKEQMNGHAAFAMDDALEGARRATGDASSIAPPDPEVAATARRRQFSGGEKRRIRVGRDCWIGAHALIMDDIGDQAVVAAGAVVTRPVPPAMIVAGVPARAVRARRGRDQPGE